MSIGQDLQSTIHNLEHLRDTSPSPSQDLISSINKMYDLAVQYAAAQIDAASPGYDAAAAAMSDAQKATLAAIANLQQTAAAMAKVASAIKALAPVIAAVA